MNDERLSDRGVLSVERERTKLLDMEMFVNRFALEHGNRRIRRL